MTMTLRLASLLVLIGIAVACDDDDDRPPPDAGRSEDAGNGDAAREGDAGREAWGCSCDEDGEDCAACIEKIGTCCYEDETIDGQSERLIAACLRDGACTACCDECAEKGCDELRAAGACPPEPQAPWGNGIGLDNGLMQDLAAANLTTEGLASQESLAPVLEDPLFHKFLSYLIECALPAEAEVMIAGEVFTGGVGLAPEWAEGPCEAACQEWVTACMEARTNTYLVTVVFYLGANHPSVLALTDPDAGPSPVAVEEEGAFWGNMFVEPPQSYACGGSGRDPLLGTFRVCAQPGNLCRIQYVGPCGEIDGRTGEPSERHACEEYDEAAESYGRCHNLATLPGEETFPPESSVSDRVVTTRVARTAFSEGYADPCEGAPVPQPVPEEVPGNPGGPCDGDEDCDLTRGLRCDARNTGICTKSCIASGDREDERAQCGEDSTCFGPPGQAGYCTAQCVPHSRSGACEPGRLCTSGELFFGEPDDAACMSFCSSDEDCPLDNPCDRFGGCGLGVDMSLLADGEPCTFPPGSNVPNELCRGVCLRVDADPTHGICASLVNLALDHDCPDDPEMRANAGDDDIGVCSYRRCDVDEDCTAPLVCRDTPRGQVCTW